MRVAERIATSEGKRRYVRRLFATIADRYDFITIALSYGQDRRWKRRLVEMAAPMPAMRALDLATGTGDIAFALAACGAVAVGLDITPRMIELARAKIVPAPPAHPAPSAHPAFVIGDMLALPFPDCSFDLVTTGYGLRNVPDLTISKATSLYGERVKMEIIGNFFNILNHAEFNNPTVSITSSTFGQISATADPRIIQFTARLTF